jgi:large subunit ribosomal protein L6
MSKIADRVLLIPDSVLVKLNLNELTISGPNGVLIQKIPNEIALIIENEKIITKFISGFQAKNQAILGTINSIINNMIKGVTEGFQKGLEIKGVGYKVVLNERNLDFSLGYSHHIELNVPKTLTVECLNNIKLTIKGADKQEVGWFASKIRDFRKPNPFVKSYKGIFYQGETIKIKSGKKETKK